MELAEGYEAALSGIAGSISIACWVVVFSPQIIENFRRSSAEGLSVVFIVVWLLGDVFNILGAVLQGVLPTMTVLAVYYTVADIVLLAQCFYYKGFTLKDNETAESATNGHAHDERSSLLPQPASESPPGSSSGILRQYETATSSRRSSETIREHIASLDGVHFSPTTPLHGSRRDAAALTGQSPVQQQNGWLKSFCFNLAALVAVCLAGFAGWYVVVTSNRRRSKPNDPDDEILEFDVLAQVFGYICAVLYLGSRVPQLLLNYRRKSTEGLSILFFLFACVGNATYVFSILLYTPPCSRQSSKIDCMPGEADQMYWRYILINLSWIIGSFGTLLLDAGVFVQYFWYRSRQSSSEEAIE